MKMSFRLLHSEIGNYHFVDDIEELDNWKFSSPSLGDR